MSDEWNRAPSVVIARCVNLDKHMSMTEDDGGAPSRMMVKPSSCQGRERILDRVGFPLSNSLDFARTLRGTWPTWINWRSRYSGMDEVSIDLQNQLSLLMISLQTVQTQRIHSHLVGEVFPSRRRMSDSVTAKGPSTARRNIRVKTSLGRSLML